MLDQQPPIGVSPLVHMQSFRPFPVHLKLGRRYTVCVCVFVFWFKCFNNRSISRLCNFWARVHVYTVHMTEWTRYFIAHVLEISPSHWNWTKWIRHKYITVSCTSWPCTSCFKLKVRRNYSCVSHIHYQFFLLSFWHSWMKACHVHL